MKFYYFLAGEYSFGMWRRRWCIGPDFVNGKASFISSKGTMKEIIAPKYFFSFPST
jgi:hypothetical protein